MPDRPPVVLSIHIPKTAGVSLRNILKEHYGTGFFLHYWEITDSQGAVCEKIPPEAGCVHGHYHADLLVDRFPGASLVTWVRDPVERVVSSYYHRLRDPDWRHPVCRDLHERRLSLSEYASLPLVRNEMTAYFASKKPRDFLCIGIVEKFEPSLERMAQLLGIPEVKPRRDNVNPAKVTEFYELTPFVRREIEALNEQDLVLYEDCLRVWGQNPGVRAVPVDTASKLAVNGSGNKPA